MVLNNVVLNAVLTTMVSGFTAGGAPLGAAVPGVTGTVRVTAASGDGVRTVVSAATGRVGTGGRGKSSGTPKSTRMMSTAASGSRLSIREGRESYGTGSN